ncbi:class I SAM-dependent methyltransferase [Pseudonocardia sp. ICBG1122]|nr:class I SAM-dependent methyltransferase [Pseudonocardia pini]
MTGPEEVDFDAIYRGGPALDESGVVPWDIGELQPALLDAVLNSAVEGPVLDAGCGTGLLAQSLSEAGHEAVGIDIAPTAIAQAREAARSRKLQTRFEVGDLTRPLKLGLQFATIFDCALLHNLDDGQAEAYLTTLAAASVSYARLWILSFSDQVQLPGIHGRSETKLTGIVDGQWTVEEVEQSSISILAPAHVGNGFPHDDSGRLLQPAWLLSARKAS